MLSEFASKCPLDFHQSSLWIPISSEYYWVFNRNLSGFSSEYSLDAHYNPVGITIGIVSGLSSESSKYSHLNLLFSHQNHLWILIITLFQNSHWNLMRILIRILSNVSSESSWNSYQKILPIPPIIPISILSDFHQNSLNVLIRILPEFLFDFFLDYHWIPFRFLI